MSVQYNTKKQILDTIPLTSTLYQAIVPAIMPISLIKSTPAQIPTHLTEGPLTNLSIRNPSELSPINAKIISPVSTRQSRTAVRRSTFSFAVIFPSRHYSFTKRVIIRRGGQIVGTFENRASPKPSTVVTVVMTLMEHREDAPPNSPLRLWIRCRRFTPRCLV
jgi:hypothetical protein